MIKEIFRVIIIICTFVTLDLSLPWHSIKQGLDFTGAVRAYRLGGSRYADAFGHGEDSLSRAVIVERHYQ